MRQGGEPQGVQVVRQGEPTPYHCDFNPLYFCPVPLCASCRRGALPFLCFAKLPSLRTVFRAQREIGLAATCGCAASNMQALVPRKTTLRSAAPAENDCNLTICAKDSAFRFLIDLLWVSGSLRGYLKYGGLICRASARKTRRCFCCL